MSELIRTEYPLEGKLAKAASLNQSQKEVIECLLMSKFTDTLCYFSLVQEFLVSTWVKKK